MVIQNQNMDKTHKDFNSKEIENIHDKYLIENKF